MWWPLHITTFRLICSNDYSELTVASIRTEGSCAEGFSTATFLLKPRFSCMATGPRHRLGISAPNFSHWLMLPSPFCFLFSYPSHLTPWFSSHSSPLFTSSFIFWGIKCSLDVSRVSIVHPHIFGCIQSSIFSYPSITHMRAHERARGEKTRISSCSPSCSRPGLFPLIRLLVTPTRAHKRTCRGSKNDVASSTQLLS